MAEHQIPNEFSCLSELLEVARDGFLIPWEAESGKRILHAKAISGDTLLHVAAARGRIDEITYLLENGLNIDAVGDFDTTPLHCAALCGHVGAFEFLVRNGADPTRRNNTGATAAELLSPL